MCFTFKFKWPEANPKGCYNLYVRVVLVQPLTTHRLWSLFALWPFGFIIKIEWLERLWLDRHRKYSTDASMVRGACVVCAACVSVVWYGMVWYGMVWCGVVWRGVLYYGGVV